MNERIDARGVLTVRLTDRAGRVCMEGRYGNRIVKSGRLMVAQQFSPQPGIPVPGPIGFIGVGTDSTAAADAQTALVAERARNPITSRRYEDFTDATGAARVRIVLTTLFDYNDANGAAPLTEAGSFTTASGGTMYNRVVFPAVTKTNAFQLTLLWNVEF
ncbi:hypothetical protein [Kutzneria sp. NPDC052558]|uniref:hypothetical protein n=1 Tax=Kutzneria sp. NPDC052558 TaxID=3364121 RepID=UPI0037C8729E